jgi:hypothetical protein
MSALAQIVFWVLVVMAVGFMAVVLWAALWMAGRDG